ncbi:MAG: hypothetical protein WB643_11400, partial [Candidatus Bathyarchaeia archaeon]
VLEETGLIAEQKLHEHFPDLPTLETTQVAVPEPAISIPDMEADIDEQVYDYARKHDGDMSVESCAQELHASPVQVKIAIQRLRENGKVVIE